MVIIFIKLFILWLMFAMKLTKTTNFNQLRTMLFANLV